MREGVINRKTNETDIRLKLELDGSGKSCIDTGCGFLDHMLTLFARHGRFDLTVSCKGDTEVDYHHTTEDIGIALGDALEQNEKSEKGEYCLVCDLRGVTRYGSFLLPMDEALIQTAVDLSGRAHLSYALLIPTQKVGDFDTELTKEFFLALVRHAGITLHIRQLAGENAHHIIEGAFKSVARSLAAAVKIDAVYQNEIPSTKGVL
mgnify:CR=1 FL=1